MEWKILVACLFDLSSKRETNHMGRTTNLIHLTCSGCAGYQCVRLRHERWYAWPDIMSEHNKFSMVCHGTTSISPGIPDRMLCHKT